MDHGKLKHGAHTSLAIGAEAPAGDEDLGSSTTSAISTRALLLGANGSDGNVDTKNVYNDGTAVDLDVDLDLDVENGNGATSALPRAPGKPRKKRAVTETPSRCLLASLAVLLCTLVVGAGCWVIVNRLMHPLSGRASSTFERPVTGMHGAVATEHGTCSQIGVDLLKEGGNALDAAIAGALCIGVVNSFSSGVGGGGFMMIRLANGTSVFVDFRERAPMASNETMFVREPWRAQLGGLAVAVPGEIRGMLDAHQKYGLLPWRRLFQPSIALARDGFPVTAVMQSRLDSESKHLLARKSFLEVFAPNGSLLRQGDVIRRERFAKTLEVLAEDPESFYSGKIAKQIVATVQADGGILTMDDMREYRAVFSEPLSTYYHGHKMLTGTAPSSGPVLLSILNQLERYNLARDGRTPLNTHRLIEAFKHGYAQRTELADPAHLTEDERARINEIASKDYAAMVRGNISDVRTFPVGYYQPKFEPVEAPGTTHLAVVDRNDMAVSLMSTVNLIFGAKLMDGETGIILNNEMDDFSTPGVTNAFGLPPSPMNYVRGGKRPLSSAAPTIIERDGRFEMAIGASGGSIITTSVTQTILNTLDFSMNIQQAITTPRVHHQLLPHRVHSEHGYDGKALTGLEERGHEVDRMPEGKGLAVVQAVMRLPLERGGVVQAGADPRKGGLAVAY